MDARQENFLKLFLRHEKDLRAFIGSLILDRHVREDVFQDVALELWRQMERYDPTRPFGAWARGIAARKILQHRERDGRFPLAFAPETIQAILNAYDRTEGGDSPRLDALRHCVQRLPDRARHLLGMRYEQELTIADIAQKTGRTLDAIYQALSRVRVQLEDCIRQRLAIQ